MSANVFPWWEDTVTIYNRYEDPLTNIVKWYKHTVDNCFWKNDDIKISIGNTVLEGNSTMCRIPQSDDFIERHSWESLTNDLMGNYFTLGVGDIVIRGEVDDVVDEYTNKHRSSDLLAKYKSLQGCIEIKSVSINTGTAKCIPHYLIRGA